MWARPVELMLACWLGVSPFVFRHAPDETYFWWGDLGGAAAVGLVSLFSFWSPTKRAHLLVPVIGAVLIAGAFLTHPYPLPPALQNHVLVGLLLLMMGIIPTEATVPPDAWREFDRKRAPSARKETTPEERGVDPSTRAGKAGEVGDEGEGKESRGHEKVH